jgi:hypothetical protein
MRLYLETVVQWHGVRTYTYVRQYADGGSSTGRRRPSCQQPPASLANQSPGTDQTQRPCRRRVHRPVELGTADRQIDPYPRPCSISCRF